MCCGSDHVQCYLDSGKRQPHEFYYRLPLDKTRCHYANTLAMTMSHSEKTRGDYSSGATSDCVISSSGSMNTLEEKNICLFDGRIIKPTFKDFLTENPLQKGVRKTIDKHKEGVGPFEGSQKTNSRRNSDCTWKKRYGHTESIRSERNGPQSSGKRSRMAPLQVTCQAFIGSLFP